jgi:hypothetical protein
MQVLDVDVDVFVFGPLVGVPEPGQAADPGGTPRIHAEHVDYMQHLPCWHSWQSADVIKMRSLLRCMHVWVHVLCWGGFAEVVCRIQADSEE